MKAPADIQRLFLRHPHVTPTQEDFNAALRPHMDCGARLAAELRHTAQGPHPLWA
jgi:hypothetical protein